MKVAVTSTVVFEVADAPLEKISRQFLAANKWAIGQPFKTVTGQMYVMLAIERFEVVAIDATAAARRN